LLVHVLFAARPSAHQKRIRRILQRHPGALLTTLGRIRDLWPALNREEFDFVVLDRAFLGDAPGRQVAAVRALPQRPEVVVVRGADAPESPAELIAAGCLAVLDPDLPEETAEESLRTLMDRHREEAARRLSAESLLSQNRLKDFASASPSMNRLLATSRRLAMSDSSILILGETGVGKEWLARAIHAESRRAAGPFIAVNCAALPESLLESELFGHERGAFTGAVRARRGQFELAHGGTLFLDEVAETQPHIQVKLLRVLQERLIQRLGSEKAVEVDVRVMAATNRDPSQEIAAGRLRPDVYYRLGVVVLTVPPLRERAEDIPLLAKSYMERFRMRLARDVRGMEEPALAALARYAWPGNVRELINVMERAVLLCSGGVITLADLPEEIGRSRADATRPGAPSAGRREERPRGLRPLRDLRREVLASFERNYISEVLRASGGRVGEAARRAGLNPRALYGKMREYGIHKEDFKFSPEAAVEATPDGR
jgi:DNA-binding NtrC family response regulator